MKRIIAIAAILAASLSAYAQKLDTTPLKMTRSRAMKLVPRPFMDPVPSLEPIISETIDTLDTEDESLKIVLYRDGQWKFLRNGDIVCKEDSFIRNWDNSNVDPFRTELSSLPAKSIICLVDSAERYCFPGSADSISISSRYGRRHGRYHRGIDIRLPKGNDIYATFDGKVRISKYKKGYGNLVVIRHHNGLETLYSHMSKINVSEGDWVEAGQVIGLAGTTGRSTGPHLHYEVRYKGYAIDPEWMIDFKNGNLNHSILVIKKSMIFPDSKYSPETDEEEAEIYAADEADRKEAERLEAEMKAAKYHKVKNGETLSGIAVDYGTTVSSICKLNGIRSTSIIQAGRTLRVK